ncbi:hypothetical protein [Dyadobacter psychrotolerans]|uniref:Uncharacterized protein n=1 Tax=Dyadobacter psychrotolerans TaxID=2541721 RepID=A0A4R5DKP1_9BACT|nr:hypothetical protein [Dyadobacter psychrotolerans]TDE14619.1 hypothetical protein E0F88_15615 [Dyadobacter psychrotolerans]
MDTLRINILNPKARTLLKDLADMDLIEIQDTADNGFAAVLKRMRSKQIVPSLDDITREVEKVRTKRYAK